MWRDRLSPRGHVTASATAPGQPGASSGGTRCPRGILSWRVAPAPCGARAQSSLGMQCYRPVLPWGCWTGCAWLQIPPCLLLEEAQNRWGSGCVFLGCDRFAQYYKLAVLVCFPSIKRKMLQNCLEYEWIHTPYVAIYIYIHLGHPAGLVMEQVLVVSSYSSAHKHLSANNWILPCLHLNCSL